MFCTKCGNKIEGNARFCTKCGAPVKIQEGMTQPGVNPPGVNPPGVNPPGVNPPGMNPVYNGADKTEKKKGRTGLWIAVVCLSVLLVAGGVVIFFLLGKNDASEQQASKETGIQAEEMAQPEETTLEVSEEPEVKEPEETEEVPAATEAPRIRQAANMNIHQVDNTTFPSVGLYVSALDANGAGISGLSKEDFSVREMDASGNLVPVTIDSVYQVLQSDNAILSLVLDMSSSMDGQPIVDAKNAANTFLSNINLAGGDRVSIISFNEYVYLGADFCSDYSTLSTAVNDLDTSGCTAMYDGIFAGIYQAYYEQGAKCVIAFTDGMTNAGTYTREDVVSLSQSTGIPVYLIGIGDGCDGNDLQALAAECSGEYFYLDYSDISTILNEIYSEIYQKQRESYVLRYTSSNQKRKTEYRDVEVSFSEEADYTAAPAVREYLPEVDVNAQYGDAYKNKDYILPDSDWDTVTYSDLAGLSLAELRIARNEIFARHGRLFEDDLLNKWFFSKDWYLNIHNKKAPSEFSYNFSQVELDNVDTIRAYEEDILQNEEIFPEIEYSLLREYDVCLHYNSLKRALSQAKNHRRTDICKENIRTIKKAMKGAYKY